MKRLHLANIANMAYSYSGILRQFGCESDVLCYDLDHWLSDPSSNIDFQSYPQWFKKVKTLEMLKGSRATAEGLSQDWLEALQRYSFRMTEVSVEDIKAYKGYVDAFESEYFEKYDVIYGYAYGAIPPLLYAERKYIPVDLGALRGLASRNDAFSKMLSFSLKAAPHIIVTNPDVIGDCKALGLERFTFVPHPIDEQLWVPAADAQHRKETLKKRLDADFVVLAPARHDWAVKGSDEIIQGVVDFARSINDKVKCVLIGWGADLDRSKQLIKDLAADEIFVWMEMQSESQLKDLYSAADALIDQMGEAQTFGLTTPKAMAAGIPVLTKFDAKMHDWCYSDMPPLLGIDSRRSITEQLTKLASDGSYQRNVIRDQRDWIDQHHSKKVIAEKFIEAENKSLESDDACRVYYSLNQKKNEIVYEKAYSEIYDIKYHDAIAYKQMDQRLIDWMKSHLGADSKIKILDLGCGPGSMISFLRQFKNAEIYGVDISPAFVEIARKKHPDIDFRVGDAEVLPYSSGTFDAVLCSGMLHHIPDLDQVFSEVRRVLKPNGFMFAREPNEDNFAARYPQVSFAHLVLKHLIHIAKRQPAVIEPEEHEFHIDFDYGGFVDVLARSFSVVGLDFGQRVSYFYDMLFEGDIARNLEQLEEQLVSAPGLNVLVACQATPQPGHVASCVTDTIERLSEVAELPKEHIDAIVDFAAKVLPVNDEYVSRLFELAGSASKLVKKSNGLGYTALVQVSESGVTIKPRDSWYHRVSRLVNSPLFNWKVKDYEGRRLYDSGLIVAEAHSASVGYLAKAIESFRDYSLVVLKIPQAFRMTGVPSDEEMAVLAHAYVVAQASDGNDLLYVISPKLFTNENLKSALVSISESNRIEGLERLSSPFKVDFFESNLFKLLSRAG
jgi:ubiquinone/menaquinone biosynthesis C-methylase UbiE